MRTFDAVAPFYDLLASLMFWGAIKRSQIHPLESDPPYGKVLIIGGGTGWILEYVLKSPSVTRVDYVECSQKMLDRARKRAFPEVQKVNFIRGDERSIPEGQYDAIVTNFFLDCFEEDRLQKVITVLDHCLKTGGHWYFSDFRIGKAWYAQWWQKPLTWAMIRFFRLTSGLESTRLIDFSVPFASIDLQALERSSYFGGFIESTIYIKQ